MSDRAVTTQLTRADEIRLTPLSPAPGDVQASLLDIETLPEDRAPLVVVSGSIDLVTEQALHNGLSQAVARSERGVELDLSGVDFCDCSGLNVLLRVRRRALDEGKTLTIRSAGAAMLRLFSITGTLPLFTGTGQADETAVTTEADEIGQDLRIELVQLRRAMQTRPVIDLARGILMASFGLNAEDSWQVLVSVSQNTNTKLHEVADNLVDAVTGDPLPEPLRLQIAKTVTGLRTPPKDPSPSGPPSPRA